MARIFISHSSADNDQAAQMKAWLTSVGFESAFLDKDKTTGIPPGADWERTLYREVELSQAVIIIQTPNWLASKWCFAEFTQARALGKAIFPAIEAPTGDTLISPDIQALNLLSDRDGGLDRLKRELVRIALDAQGGFPWDATRAPFPGLLAFQEEDAAIYFGRDDDIRRLIERLEARRNQGGARLIALLGSSGSGKSSLLRAGVTPRLKRAGRNWIVIPTMRPRLHPIDELANALAAARNPSADWAKVRDDLLGHDPVRALDEFARTLRGEARANEAQVLIPIDQAEELFGIADSDEAKRFLAILSQALSESLPFMAVMTIRSDFLGQLQSAATLTARFEEFSLGPMPLARVPQIIEGPARVAGLKVDEALVQQAASDAETEDALPLLAFALRQLWDQPDRTFSLQAYSALGDQSAGLTPLENAVRKAADAVLADVKPTNEERTALREAFVPALVRVNEQGEYVRRPARMDALPAKANGLLKGLADARLLILRDEGVVEVAHEALLRKWPWLKGQLDAERVFLIGKQQLEQDLRDWQAAADKDKADALLTGLKLSRDRAWLVEHPTRLTAEERSFIQASVERDQAEKRRRERTRRIVTWGSMAAAVVLAAVAFGAFWELLAAQAARKIAIANETRALTALSQAASLNGRDADAAKLALAAWPHPAGDQRTLLSRTISALMAWPRSTADQRPMMSRTIDALGQALLGPVEISRPLQHDAEVFSAAFSPDGKQIVTASGDNTARVWDAATGAPVGKPMQHEYLVARVAFSPDGARVMTASDSGTARVWDAATGSPIDDSLQHKGQVISEAFSPDGKQIVTASDDNTARVVDAATGTPIGKPMQHEDFVNSAAFSPDGARVLTKSGYAARIWDAATGALIGKPVQDVNDAAFSPDGARVVTRSDTVQVWDAATGALIGKPIEVAVDSVAFSPDGARVVTRSGKTAQVWDTVAGAQVGKPMEHEGPVASAAFGPDGARVLTVSWDKTAQLWDAETGEPIGQPLRHNDSITSAAFSPDGAKVVTASKDRTARLWDAETGTPIGQPLRHGAPVASASFSPDGARLVTASERAARVWDSATGAPIGRLLRHEDLVYSVAFSPDGARVITASEDRTYRLWNTATGAQVGKPMDEGGTEGGGRTVLVAFSPDGARVITASEDRTATRVWNTATGAPIGEPLQHNGRVISTSFSLNTARVVIASDDKTARVLDAATGAAVGKPMQHEDSVYDAAFSPDGSRVVTVSGLRSGRGGWVPNTVRVWEVVTGAPVGKPLQNDSFDSAAFSPDGSRVVTVIAHASGRAVSRDTLRVWDAATGAPIGKPMQHDGETINSVAFSPDGKRVVTASYDKTARIWDAATGEPIGPPLRHYESVVSAAFSPDGARVVTASDDHTARVWDAATGALIGQPLLHEDRVRSAAFSPDGARLVTASGNAARLWKAPPVAPNIIATACKLLGSNHDTADLAARYGIEIKDPICTPDPPAPDRKLMIDR